MSQSSYESGYDPTLPLTAQCLNVLAAEVDQRKSIASKLVSLSNNDPEVFEELCRTEGYDPNELQPIRVFES